MIFLLIMMLLTPYICHGAKPWGYHYGEGLQPGAWGEEFDTCNGKRQSPIDIGDPEYDETLLPLMLKNYEKEIIGDKLIVSNNGYTVLGIVTEPTIGIRRQDEFYNIHSFHFHWGHYDQQGSEHQINGRSYPLEMHLVHWKTAYGSFENATDFGDGLLVWGHLFEINERDETNTDLDVVVDQFSHIKLKDKAHEITKPLKLKSLVVDDSPRYYTHYEGSLTTPGCKEAVLWFVNEKINHVSTAQMNKFRSLHTKNKTESINIYDNYRPVQKRYGRKPKTTTKQIKKNAATAIHVINIVSIVFPILVAMF